MTRLWLIIAFTLILRNSYAFPQKSILEISINLNFSTPYEPDETKDVNYVTSNPGAKILSVTDVNQNETGVNEYPVVGILAQEISYYLEQVYPGMYKSFIAASYVKFVEGGGARVVPIFIDRPKEYYRNIMKKINGILFPGGATWFNQSNGYADAGKHIYTIAKEMNDNGSYFPLWGTCLGFELLTYLDANGNEHRDDCSSQNQALHLDFKSDFNTSKLFMNTPKDIIDDLKTKPVTSNFHRFCVTEKALTDAGIAQNWRVMSTNQDWKGFTFISTIEHVRYPFYGVQFHPEKNIYEWVRDKNITHTKESIRASQYFAEFFVEECRRSKNNFTGGVKEENKYLIYNFPVTFTGERKSSYEECYLFDKDVNYKGSSVMANVRRTLAFVIVLVHGLWNLRTLC